MYRGIATWLRPLLEEKTGYRALRGPVSFLLHEVREIEYEEMVALSDNTITYLGRTTFRNRGIPFGIIVSHDLDLLRLKTHGRSVL
jgi:hypothetical protein